MAIFSALLDICAGNSPVTGEFPAQKPVMGSFAAFLSCTWINGWVNNREAIDLRRHRVHYDVAVMWVIELENNGLKLSKSGYSNHNSGYIMQYESIGMYYYITKPIFQRDMYPSAAKN